VNIARQLPWLNMKFSPQALFACGGGGCDSGWFPPAATAFLQQTGVPDEACAPYIMGATGQDVSCTSICSDSASRTQKISGSNSLYGPDAIKAALANGPVITTLNVYSDFVLYKSGVYKHVDGDALGGHAVSIVGYNDVDRYWIIRNSWAADWGENGFAMVSYDDISGVGAEGWSMQIPDSSGVVAFSNLQDRDYRGGVFTISASSTFQNTTGLVLDLTSATTKQSLSCSGQKCDFTIDSSKFEGGLVQASIQVKNGSLLTDRSEVKYFHVLNSAPKNMSLKYSAKDINLAQPVSGRIEFNVESLSSPVPYTELEFIVTQNGKVVRDHISRNIADHTVLGWRTPTVPNGQYQIQLLGKIIVGNKVYTQDGGTLNVTVQN